jgi:hypothetical protein
MMVLQRIGLLAMLGVAWLCADLAPAQEDAKKNAKFPQVVLLIRHSEKTGEKGDIHLSKRGQERADALHRLFEASKERAKPFPTPDFIFAAANDKSSQRPLETVTPLAMKLKLTIHQKFDSKLPLKADDKAGMHRLRDEIFGDSKYFGKTILVAWRHSSIPDLAWKLKATNVPTKWDGIVFDRVWQINYDDQGNAIFLDRPQRLLPGDAEK